MALPLSTWSLELIRLWSMPGDGVVVHTPAYDAFYKAIEGNARHVVPVAMEKQATDGREIWPRLRPPAKPENKILLLCSLQNPTGKVRRGGVDAHG